MKTKHFPLKIRYFCAFLIAFPGLLLFQNRSYGQNGGDSIIHINCPGADTILVGMVVSDNGIIQYTTNRETGIYNIVTGKKLGTTSAHAKLFKDPQNNIWQAQGGSISKLNEKGDVSGQFSIPTEFKSLNFKVSDIALDLKGNLWLATNKGLLIKTAAGWTHYTNSNSALMSNHVRNIKVDPKNSKWIITDSGICILGDTICTRCNAWNNLTAKTTGYPLQATKSLAFFGDGHAVIGTFFGMILEIKDGKTDTLPVCKAGSFGDMISSIDIDKFGNYWVGTWGLGLIKINPAGTHYTIYNTANSKLGSNNINSIVAAHDSTIYISVAGPGIHKLKPVKFNDDNAVKGVLVQSSVARPKPSNRITMFPNPSPGIFNVTADKESAFDIYILDISG